MFGLPANLVVAYIVALYKYGVCMTHAVGLNGRSESRDVASEGVCI